VLTADGTATELSLGPKDAIAAGIWDTIVPRLPRPPQT
jgi:phosphopantothenoylcysteine decarboxylase / phosphopantothenate---cysteine ligase